MFLHIEEAHHLGEYRVALRFNDGTQAEIDLAHSLEGAIFQPLRDVAFFQQFTLEGHTLSWPNGADFAPEYLLSLVGSVQSP